jgi:acetate kinase
MSHIIISINAGSSSVKVSVYITSSSSGSLDPKQLAEVQIDGLTAPPPTLKYTRGDHKIKGQKINDNIEHQEDAFRWILQHLENDEGLPELKRKEDIGFACHRVVHGGDYREPKVVNDDVFRHVEELSDLAPL